MRSWSDDNPYYLLIVPVIRESYIATLPDESGQLWARVIPTEYGEPVEIDLGEWRWMKRHRDLLRKPAEWYLTAKADRYIPLSLRVWPGEQPYYVCRHIGMTGSAGGNEVKAYGIGKKRKVGSRWQTDRLWVLENGQVCGGDDVEPFAKLLLQERGPV